MSFIRSFAVFAGSLLLAASFTAHANTTSSDDAPATATAAKSAASAASTAKVNINTATVEQLKTIKGIGGSKAEAIVEYRTSHGPFKSVDDLASVKGFSSKTVAKLQEKNPGRMVVQ
jgi:competence protein ComEA